jgi:hypothetical protein
VLPLPDALDSVHVRTRTLLDMLTFLSKGVAVPEDHLCRGLSAQTVGPDGVVFDWTAVTRGLFHVCVQKKRPTEPAVAQAEEVLCQLSVSGRVVGQGPPCGGQGGVARGGVAPPRRLYRHQPEVALEAGGPLLQPARRIERLRLACASG